MKRNERAIVLAVFLASCTLLPSFAKSSWAQANQAETSIYDDFRQSLKSSAGISVDRQVTAIIKRYMANLLYPVDLSSFSTPDKDKNFQRQIKVLQKQMGVPETGTLTSDQFSKLAKASRDISASQIGLPGKFVSMITGGNVVLAVGTGAMDGIANPINKVRILCIKSQNTCDMTEATFDLENQFLDFHQVVPVYEIQTWTQNRVTAIREHPCGTAMMSIDVKAQTVTIVVAAHNDLKGCAGKVEGAWTLLDGFAARFAGS